MAKDSAAFSPDAPPSKEALDKAFSTEVTDENSKKVLFGDLLKTEGIERHLIVFLRHFHCGECQSYVMQLNEKVTPQSVADQHCALIFLGNGDPKLIKEYSKLTANRFPIYTSPDKELYTTLGFTKRTLSTGDKRPEYSVRGVAHNIVWSLGNMFKMGNAAVDLTNVNLQAGEMVLGPQRDVVYMHRMENSRDHTEIAALLDKAGLRAN